MLLQLEKTKIYKLDLKMLILEVLIKTLLILKSEKFI